MSQFTYVPGWPQSMECFRCKLPWYNPVMTVPCNHFFCTSCVVVNGACPSCMKTVEGTTKPTPIIENMAANALLKCERCGWQGPRHAAGAHGCTIQAGQAPPPPTSMMGGQQMMFDPMNQPLMMAEGFLPPPVPGCGDGGFNYGCPIPYAQPMMMGGGFGMPPPPTAGPNFAFGSPLEGVVISAPLGGKNYGAIPKVEDTTGTEVDASNLGVGVIKITGPRPWAHYNMGKREFRTLQLMYAEVLLIGGINAESDGDKINAAVVARKATPRQITNVLQKLHYAQNGAEANVMYSMMDPKDSGWLSFEQLCTWMKYNKPMRKKPPTKKKDDDDANKKTFETSSPAKTSGAANAGEEGNDDDDDDDWKESPYSYYSPGPTLETLIGSHGLQACDVPTLTPGVAPCSDVKALRGLPTIGMTSDTSGMGVISISDILRNSEYS